MNRVRAWLLAAVVALGGCDAVLPDAPADDEVLEGPIDGLAGEQLAAHLAGDAEFARNFGAADGVGPIFVAQACASCHVGDGKGHPVFNLTRFGRMTPGGFDPMRAHGGPQIQHRALPGYPPERVPGTATGVSVFMAPSVTGLGLIEAVDDATILALADPDDRDGDGISGRAQLLAPSDLIATVARLELLFDPDEPGRHRPIDGRYLGRFGKKAGAINLLHQTATAYREDMGLTTDLILEDPGTPEAGVFAGDGVPDPEVGSSIVASVVFYLKTLRPPPRRKPADPDVLAGEALFAAIGCAKCHRPTLTTGPSRIKPLDRVAFHPYSDLLLHDMGPELDDGYTEGSALTAEWRTAPLWGIGLVERAQGGQAFYLHDGRARTLEAAIEFHGGEGAASRAAFRALPSGDAARLIAFLRSL